MQLNLVGDPQWIMNDPDWHFMVGTVEVAKIVINVDECRYPHSLYWLTLIDPVFEDHGWSCVDFPDIISAKKVIEKWWWHLCRGRAYEDND